MVQTLSPQVIEGAHFSILIWVTPYNFTCYKYVPWELMVQKLSSKVIKGQRHTLVFYSGYCQMILLITGMRPGN